MFIGNVQETFQIAERGIVIALDVTWDTLPDGLILKIGEEIEMRNPDGVSVRTTVAGIEHADPWTPRRTFAFLLPKDFSRDRLQLGAEVWKIG
jgi:hypothetical protein